MLGLCTTQIGLRMFINVGASTTTQLLAGRTVDRVNKKRLIIATCLVTMLSMALIP